MDKTKYGPPEIEYDPIDGRIIHIRNKIRENKMSKPQTPDVPPLTSDETINTKIITYFWYLLILSYMMTVIGYVTNIFAGLISMTAAIIMSFQALTQIVLGGAVKLIQKQIDVVYKKYNQKATNEEKLQEQVIQKDQKLLELEKQLVNRDAQLIKYKVEEEKEKN